MNPVMRMPLILVIETDTPFHKILLSDLWGKYTVVTEISQFITHIMLKIFFIRERNRILFEVSYTQNKSLYALNILNQFFSNSKLQSIYNYIPFLFHLTSHTILMHKYCVTAEERRPKAGTFL